MLIWGSKLVNKHKKIRDLFQTQFSSTKMVKNILAHLMKLLRLLKDIYHWPMSTKIQKIHTK